MSGSKRLDRCHSIGLVDTEQQPLATVQPKVHMIGCLEANSCWKLKSDKGICCESVCYNVTQRAPYLFLLVMLHSFQLAS